MTKMMNAVEVSQRIGVTPQTLGNWYRFKRENPNDAFSLKLPDFVREGNRRTRYWKEEDIIKLMTFKETHPNGRNGAMGSVTQRYVGNGAKDYIERVEKILKKNRVDKKTIEMVSELLKCDKNWKETA